MDPERQNRMEPVMHARVLFIEDDIGIIESVCFAFSFYWPEAELVPAFLGKDGLDLARAGNINIIILDLGLPDISGIEVLAELRKVSSVPVIVLSGRNDEETSRSVLALGAHECMFKPFKQKKLIACIKSHLGIADDRGETSSE
jgi:DNA-binding response OmpR family regulator